MLSVALNFGSVNPETVGYERIGLSGWLATATGNSSVRAGMSGQVMVRFRLDNLGFATEWVDPSLVFNASGVFLNRAMFPNGREQS